MYDKIVYVVWPNQGLQLENMPPWVFLNTFICIKAWIIASAKFYYRTYKIKINDLSLVIYGYEISKG